MTYARDGLPPHLHRVSLGRVTSGDASSPEVVAVRCWTCGLIFPSVDQHPTCREAVIIATTFCLN